MSHVDQFVREVLTHIAAGGWRSVVANMNPADLADDIIEDSGEFDGDRDALIAAIERVQPEYAEEEEIE